jgi:hypothetical protein
MTVKPVPKLVHKLFGKVFGDKGYISKPLFELLRQTFGVPGNEVKVQFQEQNSDEPDGPHPAAKTSDCGECDRPTQEYLAN